MRDPGYTSEQLALIRDLAPTTKDPEIAVALGFKPGKVLRIRKLNGIEGVHKRTLAPTKADYILAEYVQKGRPAADVGTELGMTATNVRRTAFKRGWKREKAHALRNLAASGRKRAAERPRAVRKTPAPIIDITANDASLIADFLSRKAVTVLAPGRACGIGLWEIALGRTAWPENAKLKDMQARGREAANAARRGRLGLPATGVPA